MQNSVSVPTRNQQAVTFTFILTGKKMLDLKEKTKANSKQKKKNKKAPGAGGVAALQMNGELVTGGQKVEAGQELSGEDEEDEVSSTNSSVPPSGNGIKKTVVTDF